MADALNVCVSGGVEILGLHLSAAPRNQQLNRPALEKCVFVPYQREISVENGKEYIDKCLKCIRTGLERWFEYGLDICTESRDALNHCLKAMKLPASTGTDDDVTLTSEERQPLLHFLKDVFSLEHNADFSGVNLSNTVDNYREKLRHDTLLGCLKTDECIKPLLDMFVAAQPSAQTLQIVELDRGSMAEHVLPLTRAYFTRNWDYTTVSSSNTTSEGGQTQLELTNHVVWNKKTGKMPKELKSADLVVVDQTVLNGRLCETLEAISSELGNDDVMLLIHGATANHELAVVVDVLENKLSSASHMAGDVFDADRVVQECAKYRFELAAQVSTPLLQSLFLFRRTRRSDTSHTSRGQRQVTVTSADFDWLPAAQGAMENSDDLWLLARDTADASGLVGLTNNLRLEPGGKNVRFNNTYYFVDV